jgi:hypothetical protein
MLDPPWPRTISEMKLFVIRGVPKACLTEFTSCTETTYRCKLHKFVGIPGELTIIRLHIFTGKKSLERTSISIQVLRGSDCLPENCAWMWAMGMNRVETL